MNGSVILLLLSSVVQPGLAGYAFRLNRVFGSRRVGWWLVATFVCLALLHLAHALPLVGVSIGLIDLAISALLFLGMAHTDAFCAGRVRLEQKQQKLQAEVEQLTRQCEELTAAREHVVRQLRQQEQREKTVGASEHQLRLVFAENPLPMCIFDLRSLRFLAANQAALRQYGYTAEQMLALTAKELFAAQDIPAFRQACAKPSSGSEPARRWRHCCKDGTLLNVEVRTLDLRFDNCPARLIVVPAVASQR